MRRIKVSVAPLVFIVLFPLILLGLGLALCHHKSGFSVVKIQSDLPYNENWEADALTQNQYDFLINKVLSQTYYYFDAGDHSYVFISSDFQFIFKVFKRKSSTSYVSSLPFPLSLVGGSQSEASPTNPFICERVFANYKDAYDSLRNETAIIYLHLNKNRQFRKSICLVDAEGKSHLVDVDGVEFVLDRRGREVFSELTRLAEQGCVEELRKALRSVLQLVAVCRQKGFTTYNQLLSPYFGFVDDRAVQFDCSNLTRDSSMKYPLNLREEILGAAEQLNFWAVEHAPELCFFIQKEAQRIIHSAF